MKRVNLNVRAEYEVPIRIEDITCAEAEAILDMVRTIYESAKTNALKTNQADVRNWLEKQIRQELKTKEYEMTSKNTALLQEMTGLTQLHTNKLEAQKAIYTQKIQSTEELHGVEVSWKTKQLAENRERIESLVVGNKQEREEREAEWRDRIDSMRKTWNEEKDDWSKTFTGLAQAMAEQWG